MLSIPLNNGKIFRAIDIPTKCPICHCHIVPLALTGVENSTKYIQEISFQCNNHECNHLFIGIYNNHTPPSLIGLAPKKVKPLEMNENIKSISPSFYKIYTQALEAEALGLDEITGVGLRKALEFLIKDYCVYKNPTKEEDIKKTRLMQTINTYMSEASKLRSVATKAVWLGNDETHYVRKWEDKDISHLKMLIDLTLHWIESELLTDEFEESMSK